ncbi:Shedu anti-phage system protein SduA domain-containing protein [Streptomyces goshikiensis]
MTLGEEMNMWGLDAEEGTGRFGTRSAEIKNGPKVYKKVTYSIFGDPATGEVRNESLRFTSHQKKTGANDFDFENTKDAWSCENGEIERLMAFLSNDVRKQGRYRVIDTASAAASLLGLLEIGEIDIAGFGSLLATHDDLPQVIEALTSTAAGLSAVESAVIAERRRTVQTLRDLADHPAATETDMQKAMERHHWLFGGRYVGIAERRSLTMLDSHDIPLLGADGTLHIVELKGPSIPGLVKSHRNHWIVGKEVHDAVGQAMNYLRALDHQGSAMEWTFANSLGDFYDMCRIRATVILGNSRKMPDVDKKIVDRTLRTYNSHLSRVEVLTYDDLLNAAERALRFEGDALGDSTPGTGSHSAT